MTSGASMFSPLVFLVLVVVVVVVVFMPSTAASSNPPHPVDMKTVKTLVFSDHDWADRVRAKSRQRSMQCVSGDACQETAHLPTRAMCENKGVSDEGRILWRCEFPNVAVEFDIPEYTIRCEGWSGPGDPMARSGSCILAYSFSKRPQHSVPAQPKKTEEIVTEERVVVTVTEEEETEERERIVVHQENMEARQGEPLTGRPLHQFEFVFLIGLFGIVILLAVICTVAVPWCLNECGFWSNHHGHHHQPLPSYTPPHPGSYAIHHEPSVTYVTHPVVAAAPVYAHPPVAPAVVVNEHVSYVHPPSPATVDLRQRQRVIDDEEDVQARTRKMKKTTTTTTTKHTITSANRDEEPPLIPTPAKNTVTISGEKRTVVSYGTSGENE